MEKVSFEIKVDEDITLKLRDKADLEEMFDVTNMKDLLDEAFRKSYD